MKELCVLLDEERYKMHQLAEQWKHFGTTSIHKLESQIVDYQEKLIDLEQRQILLLDENQSLKSLVNQMMMTNIHNNVKRLIVCLFIYLRILFLIRKNLNKIFPHKPTSKNKMIHFNNKFLYKICSMRLK